MKKLLSLPPNLVECFYDIENLNKEEWFCTSDPIDQKLGSGGGTTWLLEQCWNSWKPELSFSEWLSKDKKLLLHAGGQSRRLPAYAPSGKILTPIPVFRWKRGQKLKQNLLSLQVPLYERIMEKAPENFHTLIASGDVYIRSEKPLQQIPDVDVVCYGLWVEPNLARNHGVFVSKIDNPDELDYMLQKPTIEELGTLMQTHFFLMDIGIWLLSDRAVKLLMERSKKDGKLEFYDLYSHFGLALGKIPKILDKELNELKVAILPLPGGEFYHYGTSHELISSTVAIQNLVNDQSTILHKRVKPHAAIFIQNSIVVNRLSAENRNVWIENSYIGKEWNLSEEHIITGVPENNWQLSLSSDICIDIVPVGETSYIARPYGYNDAFKGGILEESTLFMGKSLKFWFEERGVCKTLWEENMDIQSYPLFPECSTIEELGIVLRWMTCETNLQEGKQIWEKSNRLSADKISLNANLRRLQAQRELLRTKNWPELKKNFEKSVFYQLDLKDAAEEFVKNGLELPPLLSGNANPMISFHDHMFHAYVKNMRGENSAKEEEGAFSLLKEGLINSIIEKKQYPIKSVYPDQIVWARSPVRIDLAGGWTDTPPYCLYNGGNVLNIAVELNGQPPLQVYIKPRPEEFKIILRSIDLGRTEVIDNYEKLNSFNEIGSPFSIPKAALALAGFLPDFQGEKFLSLEDQLKEFGCGIEVTLLAAIPAGSGLGTSSILAATVLGAISDFCNLGWDKNEICQRTLVLEQLLTTGGGWQDQYGGVFSGVKFLQTQSGFDQSPLIKWLPDFLFTKPEYKANHLLYYTGITRTAKGILGEIVRNIFLNSTEHLELLQEMKAHSEELYEVIQKGNFEEMGRLIGKTWSQNKKLDSGTNPKEVEKIINQIKDYCLGYKLPGAGGGGYLYMIAKDPEAVARIKSILNQNPPNAKARFVEMSLSLDGLQLSRS